MTYDEAQAQLKKAKRESSYWLIELDWGRKLILPHAAGIQFLAALEGAEVLEGQHTNNVRVRGLSKDLLEIRPLSAADYRRYKMAALLDLSYDAVKEMELSAEQHKT